MAATGLGTPALAGLLAAAGTIVYTRHPFRLDGTSRVQRIALLLRGVDLSGAVARRDISTGMGTGRGGAVLGGRHSVSAARGGRSGRQQELFPSATRALRQGRGASSSSPSVGLGKGGGNKGSQQRVLEAMLAGNASDLGIDAGSAGDLERANAMDAPWLGGRSKAASRGRARAGSASSSRSKPGVARARSSVRRREARGKLRLWESAVGPWPASEEERTMGPAAGMGVTSERGPRVEVSQEAAAEAELRREGALARARAVAEGGRSAYDPEDAARQLGRSRPNFSAGRAGVTPRSSDKQDQAVVDAARRLARAREQALHWTRTAQGLSRRRGAGGGEGVHMDRDGVVGREEQSWVEGRDGGGEGEEGGAVGDGGVQDDRTMGREHAGGYPGHRFTGMMQAGLDADAPPVDDLAQDPEGRATMLLGAMEARQRIRAPLPVHALGRPRE